MAAAWSWRAGLRPFAVGLLAVACFANGYDGQFVFDDKRGIIELEAIRSLWPAHYFSGDRPLTNLSFALNYAWSGLDPSSYHLVNIAIHALASVCLYGLALRVLCLSRGGSSRDGAAGMGALAVALLWASHPLHTQAVTYLVQRSESMMGLFYWLTLYLAIRASDARRPAGWWLASAAAFLLALASKPVAVTAPAALLVIDHALLGGRLATQLRRRWWWPVGLLAAAGCLAIYPMKLHRVLSSDPTAGFGTLDSGAWDYLAAQARVIPHYARLAFWPDALCLDYAWPVPRAGPGDAARVLGMGLVLAACTYGAVRRNPPAAMGLLFFISLAPTSSFVPLADAAMEHRMYVPLAFLIAGLVWSLGLLGVAARMRGMSGAGWTRLATALMLGATLALAARTAVRNRDYHDSLSMWAQVVRQRPLNARAHHNLGMMLSAVPQPDLARHHLARSVELKPEDRFMRLNYAMVLARFRVLDEAVRQYEEVLRQSPEDPGLDSLGETSPVAYSNLAVALAQQGRMREAIPAFERVTQLRPGDAPGWYNLGVAYAALGRLEEAKASLGRSLDLRPDYGQAHEAMRKLKQRMEARPGP